MSSACLAFNSVPVDPCWHIVSHGGFQSRFAPLMRVMA